MAGIMKFYPQQLLFMDDAIQGGYKAVLPCGEICNFKPATLNAGGCYAVVRQPRSNEVLDENYRVPFEFIIQDPAAWRAVGITRGWTAHSETEYIKRGHFYWELRCQGKTADFALALIDKYHHE